MWASLIHYRTLNLNISASRKDIKILLDRFCAPYMMITHAKFRLSSYKTVEGERGDGQKDGRQAILLNILPRSLGRDNLIILELISYCANRMILYNLICL